MSKKKLLPIPVTEDQYMEIKTYCLKNKIKYSYFTDILIKHIKENDKQSTK